MSKTQFALAFAGLTLLGWATAVAHAEVAEHKHRVLGLFQADRETDLAQVVASLPGIELVSVNHTTGEATFRYDADQLPAAGQDTPLATRLDQLVRPASRSSFEITPLSDTPRVQLEQVEIFIVGLDCKGCSYAAYLAIYQIPGVENAIASFKDGKVVARVDPAKTNRTALVEALEKKGVTIRDAGDGTASPTE